jgi:GAF domain-containing protein
MGISFYSPPNVPADEQERHEAVLSSSLMDPRFASAIAAIVRSAAAIADTHMAAATLILDDRQMVIAGFQIADIVTRRSTSICGHTILTAPKPLCVPDTSRDARFAENPVVSQDPAIRFYFGVPLMSAEGYPLGALCVLDHEPRNGVTDHVAAALSDMAAQIVAIPATRPPPAPAVDTIV